MQREILPWRLILLQSGERTQVQVAFRKSVQADGVLQINLRDRVIVGLPGTRRPVHFNLREAGVQ